MDAYSLFHGPKWLDSCFGGILMAFSNSPYKLNQVSLDGKPNASFRVANLVRPAETLGGQLELKDFQFHLEP